MAAAATVEVVLVEAVWVGGVSVEVVISPAGWRGARVVVSVEVVAAALGA